MAFTFGFYECYAHTLQNGGISKYTLESAVPYVSLIKRTSSCQPRSDHAKKLTKLWDAISQHSAEESDYVIEEGCDVLSITGFSDFCYSVTGFLQPEDGFTVSKDNLVHHQGSASTLTENDDSAQEERETTEESDVGSDTSDEGDYDEADPISFLGNPIIPDRTAAARVFADEIGPVVWLKGLFTRTEKTLGLAQHLIYELQIMLDQGVSSVCFGRCF
jgi:hypothetical protein